MLLLLSASARADTVYLKNGNQIEGVIASENRDEVTVGIGYGTVTLRRADIERVDRSKKEQRRKDRGALLRRQFETGEGVPKGAEKFAAVLRVAQAGRENALESKAKRTSLDEEEASLTQELADLKERFQTLNSRMQSARSDRNPAAYNDLIDDINKAGSQMEADQLRLQAISGERTACDEAVHAYLSAYGAVQEYLKEPGHALPAGAGPDAEYYAWVKDEIGRMRAEVVQDEVASHTKGRSLVVTALLNGRIEARLMVDTGASMIVLYKGAADKLALGPGAEVGTVSATMADGSAVQAKGVRLESVTVGNSTVKGVGAALLPSGSPGIDGLLGMTFLSHFIVQVDGSNGVLVLQRLK